MKKLLLVSMDAISAPRAHALFSASPLREFADSVSASFSVRPPFITNTYPVHASVLTGLPAARHGMRANFAPVPNGNYNLWITDAHAVRARTLRDAVTERGGRVASFFWPTSCRSGDYRCLPEVFRSSEKDSLVKLFLQNATVPFALASLLTFRGKPQTSQPGLDDFTCHAAERFLRRGGAELTLVHFTDADEAQHQFGPDSPEAEKARLRVAERVARLLSVAKRRGIDTLFFSDHGCRPVSHTVVPNDLLRKAGLRVAGAFPLAPGEVFAEPCGGSLFLHGLPQDAERALEVLRAHPSFGGMLSRAELEESGYADAFCGVFAAPGFNFYSHPEEIHGQHGFPVETEDDLVFYAATGPSFRPGAPLSGGSLLELAPLAAHLLGLSGFPALPHSLANLFAE